MNGLAAVLLVLALALTQVLAGGRNFALCLPGYALLALAAVLSILSRRERLSRSTLRCLVSAGVFFAYTACRAFYSPEEYLARSDLFAAFAAAAMYLLLALKLTSSSVRGLLVASVLLLAAANCLIGAIQFTGGENFMVFDFLGRPDYGPRASGFFGYPNHLAFFLEIGLFMGLSVSWWSQWRIWLKILAGYFSLICLVGILLSGSRGGYLGVVVGLSAFGVLSLRLAGEFVDTRAIALILAGGILLGVGGWGAKYLVSRSTVLQARIQQNVNKQDTRVQIWRSAVRQFELDPVVGTGSGTFLYYGREYRDPSLQTDPTHAHNEYLELLAEYGIVGLALAVMFICTHLHNGLKSFTWQISRLSGSLSVAGNSLALTVGALSAVSACLAHSVVDFTLHLPANTLIMALVFGVLANPDGHRDSPSEGSLSVDLHPYLRWVLPALGLFIGAYVLPKWPAEYFAQRATLLMGNPEYSNSEADARRVEDLLMRGLRWDASNPTLYSILGNARSGLARGADDDSKQRELYSAALSAYQKYCELAPQDVSGVLALARAFDALKRFSDSDPLFERALKLDPNSGLVRYAYGNHLHKQGKLAEAEVEYRRSLSLGVGVTALKALERLEQDAARAKLRTTELQVR